MSSVHLMPLFFLVTQDLLSCVYMKPSFDSMTVALGDSLTLNCSYNCSTGFVRGCWRKASDNSGCLGKYSKSSFCSTSLHLSNLSTEDLKNYTCYTEDTEDPQLPRKLELTVLLQLEVQTSAPNWTTSLPAKPEDSSRGEFIGIKVLATVTVTVAIVLSALAAYLCLHQNRRRWSGKGESVESRSGSPLTSNAVLSPLKGSLSAQSERVTLRIPTPDNESDTEVPYADIMITVRGVSTPELSQVSYLTPGDQNEWWGDDSRCHLQASRSGDRLHVPLPKEVSRKMSTNSEYAVITYA